MFLWLWRRLFRRGFASQRDYLHLTTGLEDLVRSGVAGWLLAQEKARLDYLAAKDAYEQRGSGRELDLLLERLLQLQSTNAVIQALLNEHHLEQLLREPESTELAAPVRKSR
jgi:hypothetical protein